MLDLAPYFVSSAAGLILVLGCLFLLWKGRIILDTKGENVSSLDLPGGIKFSTQFPVLIMFAFGVILLGYPIYQARNICEDLSLHKKAFPEMVQVTGKIVSDEPVDVFAVVDEQSNTRNALLLNVPFKKGTRYRVLYSLNNHVLESSSFAVTSTEPVNLNPYEVQSKSASTKYNGPINTVPQDLAAQYMKGENR